MAKKITITGSNLLSDTSQDWGGVNDSDSPVSIHGTTVPAGAEWGMNRGEVERFIKEQLGTLFDCVNSGYRIAGFITPGNSYTAKAVENTCYVVLNNTGRSWYVPSGQTQGAEGVIYMPPASYTPSGSAPSSVTGWTTINLLEATYAGRVVIIGYRNGAWIAHQQEAATKTSVDAIDTRLTTAEGKIDNLGEPYTETEIGIGFPVVYYYCNDGVWSAAVVNRQASYVLPAETLRGRNVRIAPNTERAEGVRVCFLKSAPVANTALDFCDGESGEIQTTEAITKTIPADCSYIVFRTQDYVSGTIIKFSPKLFVQVPMAEQVSELMGIRYAVDTELSLSDTILYWINEKNAYANDSLSHCTFISAESYRGRVLRVEPSETWRGGYRIAFLASVNSTTKPSGAPDYCVSEPCIIQGTSTVFKTVPSDCSYIYIQATNRENVDGTATAVDCSPKAVSVCNEISEKIDNLSDRVENAEGEITTLDGRMTAVEEAIENLPSGGGGGSTEERLGVGYPIAQYYCETNGVWTLTANGRKTSYVMNATPLQGKTLRIVPSSTFNGGSRLCFLKSAPVASTVLDFCSGETGEIISAVEYNKEVPEDCSYIVIRVTDWASGQPITNVLPQVYVEVPMAEQVESLLDIQYVRDEDIDISTNLLYSITEKGIYQNDRYALCKFIPAEPYRGKTLYVEAKETPSSGARVACLASVNSTTKPSGTPDYCSATPQIILVPPATNKYVTIPNDCAYLYVQTSQRATIDGVAGAQDISPKEIYFVIKVNEKVDKVAGGIPANAVGDFGTLKAYTKSPFGLSSSLYAKDAAKRMMPTNIVPFILIVGQSNADGRCTTSDAPSWLSGAGYAIEGYKMWNDTTEQFSTFNVTTNNGAGTANGSTSTSNQTYSFDAYFAHSYLAQFGGQLYALKHTIGATPIHAMPTTGTVKASWNPDIKSFPEGCRPLLAELIGKLKSAREWATANGKQLFPIAILWHQGETDGDNNDYQYYKNDVANVWGYIRGCFGAQNIPILTGYINEQYKAAYSQINDALDALALEDDYLKVVDMSDHFTGRTGDLVHYNEAAISYMGEQMFADYNTLNLGV